MDYFIDRYFNFSPEVKSGLKQKFMILMSYADWACGAQDVRDMFRTQPTLIACEILFTICSIFTLIHAIRNGGRYVYLWLGIFVFGLANELMVYDLKYVNNFWHAQSMLTFFGRRLPLYVMIGFYPTIGYTSVVAATKLHLPWWSEAPCAGLLAAMFSIPHYVIGTKLLWITWHDTDPNIRDRTYNVPWTLYYFRAASVCSFVLLLKLARYMFLRVEYDWKLFVREFYCAVAAGILAVPIAFIQFVPVYNVFHDMFNVHSQLCTLVFLFVYAYLTYIADRNPKRQARPHGEYNKYWYDELGVIVILYYVFYIGLLSVAEPSHVVSTGMHEPIGSCDSYEYVRNVLGLKHLKRRRYLCPVRYNEPYYDFRCLPGGKLPTSPQKDAPLEWYTICGTPYENFYDFAFFVWSWCLTGLIVFHQCLARSGDLPVILTVKSKAKRKVE